MPAYDYRCPKGHEWEDIHSVADCDIDHPCPECQEFGSRLIKGRAICGAIWDKKIRVGGLDHTFETNADFREYQEYHPEVKIMSRDDSWMRNHKDNAREGAERMAVKMGYRDWDDKSAKDKASQSRGFKSDVHERAE